MRKYSIGVVSVLAVTMFVVSSHEAQASKKKHQRPMQRHKKKH
ncbi:YSIRK-type signal peptide-containing protein [Staphylococcus aureus]